MAASSTKIRSSRQHQSVDARVKRVTAPREHCLAEEDLSHGYPVRSLEGVPLVKQPLYLCLAHQAGTPEILEMLPRPNGKGYRYEKPIIPMDEVIAHLKELPAEVAWETRSAYRYRPTVGHLLVVAASNLAEEEDFGIAMAMGHVIEEHAFLFREQPPEMSLPWLLAMTLMEMRCQSRCLPQYSEELNYDFLRYTKTLPETWNLDETTWHYHYWADKPYRLFLMVNRLIRGTALPETRFGQLLDRLQAAIRATPIRKTPARKGQPIDPTAFQSAIPVFEDILKTQTIDRTHIKDAIVWETEGLVDNSPVAICKSVNQLITLLVERPTRDLQVHPSTGSLCEVMRRPTRRQPPAASLGEMLTQAPVTPEMEKTQDPRNTEES